MEGRKWVDIIFIVGSIEYGEVYIAVCQYLINQIDVIHQLTLQALFPYIYDDVMLLAVSNLL